MKYRHFVTATPAAAATTAYASPQSPATPVYASGDGHGSRPPVLEPAPRPVQHFGDAVPVFRMPPVVQFLANVDPGLARYLTSLALQVHLRGGDGRAICDELNAMAMRLGFTAILNLQEVSAQGMPSHPGQRVVTSFVMLDLQPL